MTIILLLLLASLSLGASGLCVFLWSVRAGQYDDLDGAANRILFDEAPQPCCSQQSSSGGRIESRA